MSQKFNNFPDDEFKQLMGELRKLETSQLRDVLQIITLIRNTNDVINLTVETANQKLKLSLFNVETIQNFDDFLVETIKTLKEDLDN